MNPIRLILASAVGLALILGVLLAVFLSADDPTRAVRLRYQHQQQSKRPTAAARAVPSDPSSDSPPAADVVVDERGVAAVLPPGAPAAPPAWDDTPPPPQAPLNALPPLEPEPALVDPDSLLALPSSDIPVPDSVANQGPPGFPDDPSPPVTFQRVETLRKRFLFQNRHPGALAATVEVLAQPQRELDPRTTVPRGEYLVCVLGETVISESQSTPVVAFVWHDLYYQGRLLLEHGTKLLGSAAPGRKRDRIDLTFESATLLDGRVLELSALAKERDKSTGLRGYLVGDQMLRALTPLLVDLGERLATRAIAPPGPTLSAALPGAPIPGLATADPTFHSAFQELQKILMQQVEEDAPYVIVPPGKIFFAQLLQPLDTAAAHHALSNTPAE